MTSRKAALAFVIVAALGGTLLAVTTPVGSQDADRKPQELQACLDDVGEHSWGEEACARQAAGVEDDPVPRRPLNLVEEGILGRDSVGGNAGYLDPGVPYFAVGRSTPLTQMLPHVRHDLVIPERPDREAPYPVFDAVVQARFLGAAEPTDHRYPQPRVKIQVDEVLNLADDVAFPTGAEHLVVVDKFSHDATDVDSALRDVGPVVLFLQIGSDGTLTAPWTWGVTLRALPGGVVLLLGQEELIARGRSDMITGFLSGVQTLQDLRA